MGASLTLCAHLQLAHASNTLAGTFRAAPAFSKGSSVQLKYVRPFRSVQVRSAVTGLPKFLVLTGKNGSGKSNLLRAIAEDAIQVGDPSSGGPAYDPNDGWRNNALLIATGDLAATSQEYSSPPGRPASRAHISSIFLDTPHVGAPHTAANYDDAKRHEAILSRLRQYGVSTSLVERIEAEFGKKIEQIDVDDIVSRTPLIYSEQNPFALSFMELCRQYRQAWIDNLQAKALQEASGDDLEALSEPQFLDRYGPPPWEILNDAMATMGLMHRMSVPAISAHREGLQAAEFSVSISFERADGTAAGLAASDLSTGEFVLLRLAIAVIGSTETLGAAPWPRILLIDEPDAFLHPSMARSLVNLLNDTFVQRMGMTVIMTTHSPTTVALAPQESVYLVTDGGALEHVPRDRAVSALLQGVPTVSVRADSRRLVFVESDTDADLHTMAHTQLREVIGSELTLQFVGFGKSLGGGGRSKVEAMVESLRSQGSHSVYGIVDRDEDAPTADHIYCAEERYTLENYALDPVAVGLYLIRSGETSELTKAQPGKYSEIPMNEEEFQYLVNAVSSAGFGAHKSKETFTAKYCGGMTLQLPLDFKTKPGHILEAKFNEKFVALRDLKSKRPGAGEVIKKVAEDAWTGSWELIPEPLLSLYKSVLDDGR